MEAGVRDSVWSREDFNLVRVEGELTTTEDRTHADENEALRNHLTLPLDYQNKSSVSKPL